jgi:hypothetical protein
MPVTIHNARLGQSGLFVRIILRQEQRDAKIMTRLQCSGSQMKQKEQKRRVMGFTTWLRSV